MENGKNINKDIDAVNYKEEDIENLIYTIRGKQVMLDSDVANLFHYKTKSLNLAVKRNIERFPEEFCFQLTENELNSLRFQFETSKKEKVKLVVLEEEEDIYHMYLQNKELQCLQEY